MFVAQKDSGDQRKARAAYDKLSPRAKLRIAGAGLGLVRGGPRSTELSNLVESEEKDSRGKRIAHTRVDPERASETEELVESGLAYVPAQADRERFSYAVLTRLGEATAVLAAKAAGGPRVETDAKKYSALDKACASLSGALRYLEDGMRTDEFLYFSSGERKKLRSLDRETRGLQSKIAAFRDTFGSGRCGPKRVRRPSGPGKKDSRVTRPTRS
jgi:hypothetical protein